MENFVKKLLKGLVLRNEQGVTLLEMLAAITILAFMLAILSQFLFSGLRLWGKQDRGYQQQHRLKLIHQTLYNDLSTVLAGNYLPEYSVKGDDAKIQFWSESAAGLEQITYYYDQEHQVVYRAAGFWGQVPQDIPLFKEITEWKFEYFEPKWKNWVTEWNPALKMEIPLLIRVSVNTKTGNLGTMTFPLKAWHKEDEQ
jgi:prepilin-type N-terminal cleavage/methylation domain-containing protein